MVIRRFREHVVDQNWFAVLIDVGIVVLGVFLGTQASVWNEQRIEGEQAREYRQRLIDEVRFNGLQFASQENYYETVRTYGQQALAALSGGPDTSDRDFLIAAYQLSQTDTTQAKTQIYDEMIANGMFTRIGDARLQQLVSDYYLGLSVSNRVVAETYPYRTMIREVMPYALQKRIRDACGDRFAMADGRIVGVQLVIPCKVSIEPAEAAAAARVVRSAPRLKEEMTRYIASIDEKLDQLTPGIGFSSMMQLQLTKAGDGQTA